MNNNLNRPIAENILARMKELATQFELLQDELAKRIW